VPDATLVLGGIRSGKSRFAESLLPGELPVRYIATGITSPDDTADDTGKDTAWETRVAAHRARRSRRWVTVETAEVAAELRAGDAIPTLIDDVGGWLTAAMDTRGAWDCGRDSISTDIGDLLDAISDFDGDLVLVSPEVGWSVVPATASGRLFADELGQLNQAIADRCDRVFLVVAGQPVPVKGHST
jgi:adenosylcobinamide kinase/adenosylcobinamide-phosphate guanylyltransferase